MTGAVALAALLLAEASVPSSALTEAQAVELALKNSPQVRYRHYTVEDAEAETEAGLAWNNPMLRVGGMRYEQLIDPAIDRIETYNYHNLTGRIAAQLDQMIHRSGQLWRNP